MKRARALALILALLGPAACGGGGVIQPVGALPPPPPGRGFVHIVCDPPDVDIYVDGAYAGRLDGYPEGIVPLPVGPHRLALKKRRHYTFYTQIHVGDSPVGVETHLVPEPRP